MQSNAARIVVAVGSVAAIVILLFVFSGGDDDSDGDSTTVPEATTTGGEDGTATRPPKPPKPAQPVFTEIAIVGGQPKGGAPKLSYAKGDLVRLEFTSDVNEHIHVHGYDIFKEVSAGGSVKFRFDAEIDGVFEIELEDSGVELAQLAVKP